MSALLYLAVAGVAVAAPTNLWDSHRQLHDKISKLQVAQVDLSGVNIGTVTGGTAGGLSSLSAEDQAKMLKLSQELQTNERQYNQTCRPLLEKFTALKTDADCLKMQSYTAPPNTADSLRDYCQNTCLSKYQTAKNNVRSSDCKRIWGKYADTLQSLMKVMAGGIGTGSNSGSGSGAAMPRFEIFDKDDDAEAAVRGVELMCKQEAGEYCLLTVQKVSQTDLDTVNWDDDVAADAALNTYCSPCMDAMAPMLKKESHGKGDLEKKLHMRYLICNRDNNKNFCWKQVARFAKLGQRTALRRSLCSSKNCVGQCRLVGCNTGACQPTCVNEVDAVGTVFGGKNPFERLTDDITTSSKAQTQQVTTLSTNDEDFMEDVSLVRTLLAAREKISDICENNCFQRSISKLAEFMKMDNRGEGGDKLKHFADNLCKRNEAKELCLTKLVANDFPAGCSLREIKAAGTCNNTCKDALRQRITGLACCAPVVLRAWAVSERVTPQQVRALLADSTSGCGFDLSQVECPARVEAIKKSLHLALDFAWYKNLTAARKQEFHAGVEEDLNRLLYPANVTVTECTEGSVVAQTTVSVDASQTSPTQTSATFDSQSSTLQLDATSAQVAQDQPYTSASVVSGAAPAPTPEGGSNAGMIVGVVLGVVAAVALVAIVAVVMMKKRQTPTQTQHELSTTLNP